MKSRIRPIFLSLLPGVVFLLLPASAQKDSFLFLLPERITVEPDFHSIDKNSDNQSADTLLSAESFSDPDGVPPKPPESDLRSGRRDKGSGHSPPPVEICR